MNEAETRAEHIDPALKAAGWGVVEGSRVLREHGITLARLQAHGGKGARAKAEIAEYVQSHSDLEPTTLGIPRCPLHGQYSNPQPKY